MDKLIIGCGMPRSGTGSLAKLLNKCKNVRVTHELQISLPFKFNRIKLREKIKFIEELKGDIVGDVAHYYLNYIEELIRYHKAKVLIMKRDKRKVMRSIKSLGWNPYIQKSVPGSEAFPFYAKNVDTAAGFHWQEYYEQAEKWKNRFPGKVLIVDIEDLNSKEGVKKIFDFCEIPEEDRKYKIGIREHKNFKL